MLAKPSYLNSALENLNPILQNAHYFSDNKCRVSPLLKSQINLAITEIAAQLQPAPLERIKQIVLRLIMHFPPSPEEQSQICNSYVSMLQDYPEDMICAAYQNVLSHHKYQSLPRISDFLIFMEPEMARRRTAERKLHLLRAQTNGVPA